MNKYFKGPLENLSYRLFSLRYPTWVAQDHFLKKKLNDYYFSKMIPDFFYLTPLSPNYYPTIIAARVTIATSFLFIFSYLVFKCKFSQSKENTLKYNFNIFTKRYLSYEKEMLLYEKSIHKRIILN